MDQIELGILEDYRTGKYSKKELANRHNVGMGFVIKTLDEASRYNSQNLANKTTTEEGVKTPPTPVIVEEDLPPLVIFGKDISTSDKTYQALIECMGGSSKKNIQKKFSLKPIEAQNIKQAAYTLSSAAYDLNDGKSVKIMRSNPVINDIIKLCMGVTPSLSCSFVNVSLKNDKYIFQQYDVNGNLIGGDPKPTAPVVQLSDITAIIDEPDEEEKEPIKVVEPKSDNSRHRIKRITDDMKKEVWEFWVKDKTMTYTDLGLHFGISASSVRNIIKAFNEMPYTQLPKITGAYDSTGYKSELAKPVEPFKSSAGGFNINDYIKENEPNPVEVPVPAEPKVEIKSLPNKNTNKKPVEEVETPDDPDRVPIGAQKVLRVGLCGGRHDLPCDKFIFKGPYISQEYMGNFERLEMAIGAFINSNITFNEDGVANESISLLVTGAQAPLAAVIKICQRKRVNLTLRHFKPQTGTYPSQVIWDEFGDPMSSVPKSIRSIIANGKHNTAYKCSISDLDKANVIYRINTVHYIMNSTTIDHQVIDLTDEQGKAYEAYFDHMKQVPTATNRLAVYLDQITKKPNGQFDVLNLLNTKNYKAV